MGIWIKWDTIFVMSFIHKASYWLFCMSLWISVQDWSPYIIFIWKGSQISALQSKGWLKSKLSIQEYRNEIQNSYWTCAWIIWYMFLVQCEVLRINHLTPFVVTMPYACWFGRILLRTSSDVFIFNLGLRFEGLFWERCIFKGKYTFEKHWRLQSWTLLWITVRGELIATLNMIFSVRYTKYERIH
jgi:hypothetical protein